MEKKLHPTLCGKCKNYEKETDDCPKEEKCKEKIQYESKCPECPLFRAPSFHPACCACEGSSVVML